GRIDGGEPVYAAHVIVELRKAVNYIQGFISPCYRRYAAHAYADTRTGLPGRLLYLYARHPALDGLFNTYHRHLLELVASQRGNGTGEIGFSLCAVAHYDYIIEPFCFFFQFYADRRACHYHHL